jgi:hypothetical protein
MSRTDALTFHHDLPFIPLHILATLHFISLYFTLLHFALFITFQTIFIKLLDL